MNFNDPNGSARSSSDSDRRAREKRQDPSQQASAIEKSVTHLLVATKQLLETLTQWSRGQATESEVSDVYVRLGYEFNIACRSFSGVGIDTSDLGPVPEVLRSILEETLSQEACQASLDKYLPRIRDIIINLLHGLKRKQQKLRQKTGRDGSAPNASERKHGSLASTISAAASESDSRYKDLPDPHATSSELSGENSYPTRTVSSSTTHSLSSTLRQDNLAPGHEPRGTGPGGRSDHKLETSYSDSSLKTVSTQDIPVTMPYPQDTSSQQPTQTSAPPPRPTRPPTSDSPIPRPAPKQQDALAALQRGGDLERRASRRFSAYQISKQLGTTSVGVPMIPPTQRSPVPNRGRDIRESMNAVRTRGSQGQLPSRTEPSPPRQPPSMNTMREEMRDKSRLGDNIPRIAPPTEYSPAGSPNLNKLETGSFLQNDEQSQQSSPVSSATITKPWHDQFDPNAVQEEGDLTPQDTESKTIPKKEDKQEKAFEEPTEATPTPEQRPEQHTGPMTLFLQYKTKVKKFVLAGGYEELTVPRLQVAFIEKFNWNTHSNGTDLPEIYVQDQVSGVRYELEDLNDVKDNSVLVLNVDDLNEVKRHFDDNFGGMKSVVESIKSIVNDQQTAISRIAERQQDTSKDIARLASAPPSTPPQPNRTQSSTTSRIAPIKGSPTQLAEVASLRRELAVMRQTYSSHLSNLESAMSGLRTKATTVKAAAVQASVPSVEGGSGRSYVDEGKKQLNDDSEKIINRVDDLQDLVEDLRKDVVQRGVRPLPRQLESVNRDIASATADLRKLREYLRREKPIWTKVGENELKAVCDDQNLLTMQDELATDLEDDLEKLAQTFTLVEEATKQQNLANGAPVGPGGSRSTSRTLRTDTDIDPVAAKDGMLSEVKALQPNHETRLEAIERAEKARIYELEDRNLANNAFKKELGTFVGDSRLKRTGGVEEAERLRIARDERARKENWERAAARAAGLLNNDAGGAGEQLDVPTGQDDGGTTSPEPEFMEAEEAPLPAPGGGA
ncbi:MAG: Bud site selection protein 6 [Alyxoria varia]|nr:MAG: Bud site selection protein 6 [Alyxoria varia]